VDIKLAYGGGGAYRNIYERYIKYNEDLTVIKSLRKPKGG